MAVIGGGNLSVFYTVSETTGALGTVIQATLTKKVKTSVSRKNFTIDQNEDTPELTTFFENFAPAQATTTNDQGQYEDGVQFNSATANSPSLLQIIYGGKLAADSGTTTKRKVVLMVCKLAQDAGAFDMEAGKYTKPKIMGDIVNNDAMITVFGTCFDTAYVSSQTTVTIPVDTGYKEIWITCSRL